MSVELASERNQIMLDEFRQLPAETAWLEFKENNSDPELIGKLISALANSAADQGVGSAYIVWGIRNEDHQVVGTTFSPSAKKIGNEPLEFWLSKRLSPSISFGFETLEYQDKTIVLLRISSPTEAPVSFKDIAYLRVGSATPKLSDFPERYARLIEKIRPYAWEKGLAAQFLSSSQALDLLDYRAYFALLKREQPDGNKAILEVLEADGIVSRDYGDRWNITNLGAVLFAIDLGRFDSHLSRKGVRLVAYEGLNKAASVTNRQDGRRGYAAGFAGLIDYINTLLPKNEHIGDAFREEHRLFPELSIRELIANALIHQDMTITGAGPQVEIFSDRIEISNPGKPLIVADRMIDLPPRSRNEAIASLMRRMNLCEEQGSGLDKVIAEVELFQLAPPLFRESDDAFQVVLYGPRSFADMTIEERVRACYQHTVLRLLSGNRMKNFSLCERFGIESRNAAQASQVIKNALDSGLIKPADPDHPRAGYVPSWA